MAAGMGLSAPEALVLLSLPRFDARKAIKVGLFSLLMRGALRLDSEERPGLLRKRRVVRLRLAGDPPAQLPAVMQSLLAVVRDSGPDGRMSEIVKQSMRQYGRTLTGFVLRIVGPALIDRGLAEQRRVRVLGLLPTTRLDPTAAGEAEKRRLESAMRDARAIPDFLGRDPAQAVALAAAAGSALLLIDELKPHYRELSRALAAGGDSDYFSAFDIAPAAAGDTIPDPAAPALDFAIGACDFGAFDSFDAGFAAFDTGFDAACDAGGGDGGSAGC